MLPVAQTPPDWVMWTGVSHPLVLIFMIFHLLCMSVWCPNVSPTGLTKTTFQPWCCEIKCTHPWPFVRATQGPGRGQAGLDVAPGEVVFGFLEGRRGGQADGGGVGQLPRGAHQRRGPPAAAVRTRGLVIPVRVQARPGGELRSGAQHNRRLLGAGRAWIPSYDEFRDSSGETLTRCGSATGPIGALRSLAWSRTLAGVVRGERNAAAALDLCHFSFGSTIRQQVCAVVLIRGRASRTRGSPCYSSRVRHNRIPAVPPQWLVFHGRRVRCIVLSRVSGLLAARSADFSGQCLQTGRIGRTGRGPWAHSGTDLFGFGLGRYLRTDRRYRERRYTLVPRQLSCSRVAGRRWTAGVALTTRFCATRLSLSSSQTRQHVVFHRIPFPNPAATFLFAPASADAEPLSSLARFPFRSDGGVGGVRELRWRLAHPAFRSSKPTSTSDPDTPSNTAFETAFTVTYSVQ